MVRFVIVDDEVLALESFAELLDWPALGFELAGCAANGAQALRVLEEKRPDIVFTDIRMPIMDGLELCRHIHERYPEIKVVILTAYRDFYYARTAMSYGVTEYLLKNQVEPETVVPLLRRLEEEIGEARRQKEIEQHHYYQSMMLNMASSEAAAVQGGGNQCCCMLLQCRASYILEYIGAGQARKIALDQARIAALLPPCQALSLKQVVWVDEKTWGLLLFEKGQAVFDFSRMEKPLRAFWDALQTFFEEHYAVPVFALFGLGPDTPERIKAIWAELLRFSRYNIFMDKTELCPYTRLPYQFTDQEEDRSALRRLVRTASEAAGRGDLQALEQGLQKLEEAFSIPFYDLGRFRYVCGHLLNQLDWLLDKNALPTLRQYALKNDAELRGLTQAAGTWKWIERELRRIAQLGVPAKGSAGNRKIEQALEYIHKNYQHRLTARQVGEQVGLSEVYFSNLFKREVGVTFGEYLTSYRINIAKYLIRNGDYKVYEVAEMSGYSSPQYFSQIFQKETGRTPLEYKTHEE